MFTTVAYDAENFRAIPIAYNGLRPVYPTSITQGVSSGVRIIHNGWAADIVDVALSDNALTLLSNPHQFSSTVQSVSTVYDERIFAISKIEAYASLQSIAAWSHSGGVFPTLTSANLQSQLHYLNFDPSTHTVEIVNGERLLYADPDTLELSYTARNFNFPDRHIFNYTFDPITDHATFVTTFSTVTSQYALTNVSSATGGVTLLPIEIFASSNSAYWKLTRPVGLHIDPHEHQWVKYHNCYAPSVSNADVSIKEATNVSVPFLTVIPTATIIDQLSAVADVMATKALLTPTYAPSLSSSPVREYTSLAFSPGNQALGFTSNVGTITVPSDKSTNFVTPYNALSSVTLDDLTYSGSLSGPVPAYSDTISRYLGNQCSSPDASASGYANGTFLCCWLSGSPVCGEAGVWMNRWYDPNTVTQGSALIASPTATETSPNVWDTPAITQVEPGVRYLYSRQGPTTSKALLDNGALQDCIINIESWNPPVDKSRYGNTAYVTGKSDVSDWFVCDGLSYVTVPLSQTPPNDYGITLATYVSATDWSNVNANQLLGNGGGFSISYDTGIETPMTITVGGTLDGTVATYNRLGEKMSLNRLTGSITFIVTDTNYIKWAVDTTNNIAYKLDSGNIVISTVSLPADAIITQCEIGPDHTFYVYDSVANVVFHIRGSSITDTTLLDSSAMSFHVDRSSNVTGEFVTPDTFADCTPTNQIIKLVGNNIYVDNEIVFHGPTNILDFAVDASNNCWIVTLTGTLIKVGIDGALIWSTTLPKSIRDTNIKLHFMRERLASGIRDVCLLVSVNKSRVAKYTIDGALTECFTITSDVTQALGVKGDVSGYRTMKRQALADSTIKAQLTVSGPSKLSQDVSTITLRSDASQLSPGWHHIAVVFNSNDGYAKLFIDGAVVSTSTFTPLTKVIYDKYRAPLVIGSESGKFTDLSSELNDTHYGFVGAFDDVVYSPTSFSDYDIMALAWQKKVFQDIVWNIPLSTTVPYIEEVDGWFKHKMPGHASNTFDVQIANSLITDETTRATIENQIRNTIVNICPAHTVLRNIIWT